MRLQCIMILLLSEILKYHQIKLMYYRVAEKFGGLAVYVTTAKLKSAKISYSHIYVWQSCTQLPNLNPLIFLQ